MRFSQSGSSTSYPLIFMLITINALALISPSRLLRSASELDEMSSVHLPEMSTALTFFPVRSWYLSSKKNVELMVTAFRKAYVACRSPRGLMLQSNRGTQHTAFTFRSLLDSYNAVPSFPRKGAPFGSTACEDCFKYLKKEKTDPRSAPSFHSLRSAVIYSLLFCYLIPDEADACLT